MRAAIILSVIAIFVGEAVYAGNPTQCTGSINNCKKDYQGLSPNSPQKDKCEKLGKAIGCMNAMIKSTDCQGLSMQPDQALVLLYSQDCSQNAACDKAITNCKKDYAGLSNNSPLADKCEKVGKAVGCINAQLHSDVCKAIQRQADTDDAKLVQVFNQDCGNATACETGVNSCMVPVKNVIGDPDSAKATDCPIIKNAVSCFDVMRNKQICKIVQHALLEGEKKIRQISSKICASTGGGNSGNSGTTVGGSILAVTAAVVLSLFK